MEEVFFFLYHLNMPKDESMSLYIYERRFLIERFIKQKNSEKEEIDREKRKARARR
jgi:hypothetical protein